MYLCRKCGKTSYEMGGRPVCCHCGKLAPLDDTPRPQAVADLLPEVERELERRAAPAAA